jgi:hypothetical protein
MTTIPPTCPDFVEHPHLVETKRIFKNKDGETIEDVRMSGCYTCQCSSASESQGTSQIASELRLLGIDAEVHQTGGFTMCVYIKTGENSYIYANAEGASHYRNDDDEEGENLVFFDDPETPAEKAQKLGALLDHKKIAFSKIG